MEESLPVTSRGPIARVLEALIVIAVVGWILDVPRRFGLALFSEQILVLVLGLAVALCFIVYPAKLQAERTRASIPWYDYGAAALALVITAYVTYEYADLINGVPMRPRDFWPISVVILLLVLETTRRTTGMSLIWYTIVGIIYALWGSLIPGVLSAQPISFARLVTYLGFDSNALFGSSLQVAVVVVIPFILLGQLLSRCGGSEFFTDVANACMGRYRGGSGKVAVVGSALFGMISGSAVANVSAVGVVTIPLMKRAGFSPMFAASVEAVGSTGGQLMPPVMGASAFLMAEYLQVPYSAVVIAAVIPAILYYTSLFLQVDTEAAAKGIAGTPRDKLPQIVEVLRSGWQFVVPFLVIIVGLLQFNLEPEYAALLACAVLIPLCLFMGYRGRKTTLKELFIAILSTGTAILDIVLICGAAGILIGILNISGLAFGLTLELIGLTGGNITILLFVSAVIAIVLGLGLPTVGVYVLMATLVAPALIKLGIAPIASHMFVMYFGMMSMVTPPIALAAYAAATIAKCDPDKTGWMATRVGWAAYIVPFLLVFDPALLMNASFIDIIWAIALKVAAIWCGTICVVGYFARRLSMVERGIFFAACGAMLVPASGVGLGVNGAGLAVLAAILVRHYGAARRMRVERT